MTSQQHEVGKEEPSTIPLIDNNANRLQRMHQIFRRPAAAAASPVAPEGGYSNNGREDHDADSIESLDSLHSSKSMESLETLPPFSPFPFTPKPFKSSGRPRRSLMKSASRRSSTISSAGSVGSSKSVGSDAKENTGNGDDSASGAGRSKSFRMSTKVFSSPSPKRLFTRAAPTSSSVEKTEKDSDRPLRSEQNLSEQAPSTPLLALSSISQQQTTQLLSPLTPFTTTKSGTTAPESTHVASNNSTPRKANNVTTNTFPKEDDVDILEHTIKQEPAQDEGTATNEGQNKTSEPLADQSFQDTKSKNDAELQSALDSLERNLKELRQLDSGDSNDDGYGDDLNNDDGYDEFLDLIQSDKATSVDGAVAEEPLGEKIEADSASNESILAQNKSNTDRTNSIKEEVTEEQSEVIEEQSESISSSDDDCHCLWLPAPLLTLLRGGFKNANNHRSAIITPLLPQPQRQDTNSNNGMQRSIESLRADLKAMMERAHIVSSTDKELIRSEVRIIEKSLDKLSSLSINSTEA
mmetsp:Transcript_12016/g.22328  ORF Transcript_12016/g.22328 Transcript_12016/m.22328 type:complete len:524 (-) Transcript_12016:154-1725(-)|eukprot:CAMPEP_0201930090 /NCGR_PEP_ID=MMETSP0903-20130614/24437_1 /ASSEMBLY_ACC=CAM_ASM_000552 /TAXON_ID=420261 /ORGANISM="Thalassiosira antarctica, Strain CCMP982" /LENGTH=523 /DNA_ID=CAMNT_0048469065 /DNA_START=29 /DNA_END=1600 /DNA_ORIENTATION=+